MSFTKRCLVLLFGIYLLVATFMAAYHTHGSGAASACQVQAADQDDCGLCGLARTFGAGGSDQPIVAALGLPLARQVDQIGSSLPPAVALRCRYRHRDRGPAPA